LTKYNNYANVGGGNGQNKVGVLDPNATEVDPITSINVMKEVLTVLGPTPNPSGLAGVCEWCINSAAIDQVNRCAVINSEDGHVYRWSFDTNTLSPGLKLAPPTGEAYTPTLIGPDGAVYAINNAGLFCCVAGSGGAIQHGVGGVFLQDLFQSYFHTYFGIISISLCLAVTAFLAFWILTRLGIGRKGLLGGRGKLALIPILSTRR
jgi:hypothetical protein